MTLRTNSVFSSTTSFGVLFSAKPSSLRVVLASFTSLDLNSASSHAFATILAPFSYRGGFVAASISSTFSSVTSPFFVRAISSA